MNTVRPPRTAGPVRTADTLRHWSLAALVALTFNLTLFGLLPGLIRSQSPPARDMIVARPVRIVQLPAAEPPPPPREPTPRPPSETAPPLPAAVPPLPAAPESVLPRLPAVPFAPLPPDLPEDLPPLPLRTVAVAAPPAAPAPGPGPPAPRPDYAAQEIDHPLVPISQVPPAYPVRARRKGIEGWVRVRFTVTETGAVEGVRVEAAEPAGVFEKSVQRAVTGWRFRPGTVAGRPVRTRAVTTLQFRLE